MKKMIVALVLILNFSSYMMVEADTKENKASITLYEKSDDLEEEKTNESQTKNPNEDETNKSQIKNPNEEEPTASKSKNPNEKESTESQSNLPNAGEKSKNTVYFGLLFLTLATLIYFRKTKKEQVD